ncbi:10015_t:CDS:2, partial [Cetraspora pellucida]
PKDIFAKAHINTCAVELEHSIEPYAKAHIDNNVVGSGHTFENCIDNSVVEPGHTFATFAKARATIEKYAAQTKTVIILGKTTRNTDNSGYQQALFVCERQGKYNGTNDSSLVHNHKLCSDAVKFSTVVRKLDKDDLGLIESLHDNGLRTKDIFSVLASVSSKYIHKPDIYNTVSHQRYAVLKDVYGTEWDQDGEFVQGVFWAYCSAFSEFVIARDVLIVDATYKTNRFSMPLIVICSIDHFGSTYPLAFALVYSETKDYYCWVMQQL